MKKLNNKARNETLGTFANRKRNKNGLYTWQAKKTRVARVWPVGGFFTFYSITDLVDSRGQWLLQVGHE